MLLIVQFNCSCRCSKPKRLSTLICKDFFLLVQNFKILLEGVISLSLVSLCLPFVGNGAPTSGTPFVKCWNAGGRVHPHSCDKRPWCVAKSGFQSVDKVPRILYSRETTCRWQTTSSNS